MLPLGVGVITSALLLAATVLLGLRIASIFVGSEVGALTYVHVAGLVAVSEIIIVLEILGLCGWLYLPLVLAVQCALALVAWRLLPARRIQLTQVPAWGIPVGLGLTTVALVFALSGPSPTADTMRYHLPNAAHVLQTGSLRTLPYAEPGDTTATEPGDGELLVTAALLPFHSTVAAQLPNVLLMILLAFAVAHGVKLCGGSNPRAALAGFLAVVAPVIWNSQVHTAYTDGLVAFGIASAVVFGILAMRSKDLLPIRWPGLLVGMGLGLAAGTKFSALLPAAFIGVVIVGTAARGPRISMFIGGVAGSAALALLWPVRNWIITGNPLFPAPITIAGHQIFAGLSGTEWPYRGRDASVLNDVLGTSAGAPFSHWLNFAIYIGGFSLVMTLAAIALGCRVRSSTARILSAITFLCVIAYVVTPQSGSVSDAMLNSNLRYGIPALMVGTIIFMSFARGLLFRVVVTGAVVGGAVIDLLHLADWSGTTLAVAVILGAMISGLGYALQQRSLFYTIGAPRLARVAGAAVVVLAGGIQVLGTQPSPTQLESIASSQSGNPVVVFDAQDVAAVLGPALDVPIVAPGAGTQGALSPILDGPKLIAAIEAMHPSAIVIGNDGLYNIMPANLKIPQAWRKVGTVGDAATYVP